MKEKLNQWWNKAKSATIAFGKEVWYFLSSVFFLKNFAAMVGTFILFLALIFWWLKCYTNHGESLQVADYTGLKLEDVVRKAEDRNLRIQVMDSTWIEGMEPGIVLEQNPQPFCSSEGKSNHLFENYKVDPGRSPAAFFSWIL